MATRADDFTEASGTPDLNAHTPTGANAGTGWTKEQATGAAIFRVTSATDTCDTSAVEAADKIIYTLQPNPAGVAYDVSCVFSTTASGGNGRPFSLIARFTDTSNYYGGLTYRTNATADKKIFKMVGGTATELASGDSGLANGDTMKFEVRDATKKLYHNSAEILSTTDNALTSAGRAGICAGQGPSALEDIGAWGITSFEYVEVGGAFTLAADAGSYALTGSAATLTATRLLSADAGAYALTGSSAGLLFGRLVAAESGVYLITGSDATLTYTGGYILTADAGSYAITGAAANLLRGYLLGADAGAYALTGSAATFPYTRVLAASAGVYLLTGSDAVLIWSGEETEAVDFIDATVTASRVEASLRSGPAAVSLLGPANLTRSLRPSSLEASFVGEPDALEFETGG